MTSTNSKLDPVQLAVFSSRLEAVCDEMGAVLQRSAFSPNIKDRLDFSCAVFDAAGKLSAQAAHIPVHLGSMAFAMGDLVNQCQWQPGDMVVVNDPFLGGTHLPDITVIAPVFANDELLAFVANRAHHAQIGASSAGSMPVSTSLQEEGLLIAPVHLLRAGEWQQQLLEQWGEQIVVEDFHAQVSANRIGIARMQQLWQRFPAPVYRSALQQLNDYAETLSRQQLASITEGDYFFRDVMDDDGAGSRDLLIQLQLTIRNGSWICDFSGTAAQVKGNINCPLSVVAAAVYYVFRCLMPARVPCCAGLFAPIQLLVEEGSLLNARRPAAVAAGNVETSSRVTDVVLGALAQAIPERIPAASHGGMNNVAMGSRQAPQWHYYETLAGGMGAARGAQGLSAVQTHMTNTRNTPVESLEMHYPLQVLQYSLRAGSGGRGQWSGGDGVCRRYRFLAAAECSLITERRYHQPWGLAGGEPGQCGENRLNDRLLPAKCSTAVVAGDELEILTPGGGGWGIPE